MTFRHQAAPSLKSVPLAEVLMPCSFPGDMPQLWYHRGPGGPAARTVHRIGAVPLHVSQGQ